MMILADWRTVHVTRHLQDSSLHTLDDDVFHILYHPVLFINSTHVMTFIIIPPLGDGTCEGLCHLMHFLYINTITSQPFTSSLTPFLHDEWCEVVKNVFSSVTATFLHIHSSSSSSSDNVKLPSSIWLKSP